MASVARQPFAPLDGTRLQNLTSIKNRQNALTPNSSTKRKAALIEDADDFENLDPAQFSKRSKGLSSFFPNKEVYKSAIVLTTKASSTQPATPVTAPLPAPLLSTPSSRPIASPRRSLLSHHKSSSSISKLNGINKPSSPLTPAGRSPPRSKRSGLLTSRRRAGPYSRIDPPRTTTAPASPFSLDAALKGTIPSYAARSSSSSSSLSASSALASGTKARSSTTDDLSGDSMKDSWFFTIHEDTPEQEMTNLLQHSTCVLDISSDEETESKRRREKDEGRDKENVPPADDVSQTSTTAARLRFSADENAMMVEEEKMEARAALAEMDVRSYFPEGCDESSVFVVPGDEDAETVVDEAEMQQRRDDETRDFVFAPEEVPLPEEELAGELEASDEVLADLPSVDELMKHSDADMGPEAAVLQPVEGTRVDEVFELWESGSAKDENEVPV